MTVQGFLNQAQEQSKKAKSKETKARQWDDRAADSTTTPNSKQEFTQRANKLRAEGEQARNKANKLREQAYDLDDMDDAE